YVHSSPAVGRDGTIYCGSDDRVFRALTDLGTSAIVKWSYTNPGVHSSPAIDDDGVLYVATLQTSTVYAFKN
ncbi:MAG: PQQ-binding-like beta-propeller repeat protein, partial [Planctomycetota bacterium]